ncbi:virulence factor Mce family protein [Mycolicibacterium moriokaense]|uniref:Phospholipid/cholesterol/gamma-HCH transport system substrate-binding protein n=1 Tax=Mycolicibacterium moriokaense TaxID=39691 RepID=A0A318H794_9MYCO|nr:virulence factor Mce family protein [Mycolicibacterium moriokaense]PXX00369.1 phospholipid/cholesterol/gamma-HCH transport system substrate-binding protein [Mycolicibacterium moriokaense]
MKVKRQVAAVAAVVLITALSGCGWRGLNSLPLPGTAGGRAGSYSVTAQLPDVTNIQPNSRVRVGDVTVGNIVKIEQQGWHALVTMKLDGDVVLPENATASVGQTSLLGTLHVELAPPTNAPPVGRLHEGSLIPLSNARAYPTTEQTLASLSFLLNGGGIGQLQDITEAFSTALRGREQDLRGFTEQINQFVSQLNTQRDDIIAATESMNRLVSQFAGQKPTFDKALRTIPDALVVLKDERANLAEAFDQLGKLSALTTDTTLTSKDNLVKEFNDIGPVLESLANAGPALTRAASVLTTVFPKETIPKWLRGDYANVTLMIDLTFSRLDSSFFTGTRWEGNLTELELQWGRTIGQLPSPYTAGNPLVVPYHFDQGP